MGFGILFFGYLFMLNPGVYDGFTNLFGYLIMLYAMLSLRVYNRSLKAAFYILLPLTLLGGFSFVTTSLEFLSLYALPDVAVTAVAVATRLMTLAYTATLLSGLRDLARETEIPVLVQRATLCRVLTYIYYILFAALEVTATNEAATDFAVNALIPILIFGFVTVLLNLHLIFNCYRWICLPEDLEMKEAPSRFGFVNKIREKRDEVEAKFVEKRAGEEEEKLRRKIEKKRSKKK